MCARAAQPKPVVALSCGPFACGIANIAWKFHTFHKITRISKQFFIFTAPHQPLNWPSPLKSEKTTSFFPRSFKIPSVLALIEALIDGLCPIFANFHSNSKGLGYGKQKNRSSGSGRHSPKQQKKMRESAPDMGRMGDAERNRFKKMKETRFHAIIERLKVIGWEDELQPEDVVSYGPLSELEQVNRSTELTTQDWESIYPSLIKFIDDRKAARLYRERCTLLESRETSVPV